VVEASADGGKLRGREGRKEKKENRRKEKHCGTERGVGQEMAKQIDI
jgi:hypothetical protein